MILDAVSYATRHSSLHPRFAAAFAWLATARIDDLAPGRHHLDGDALTVAVEAGLSCPTTDKRLESHRRYIDIHVTLQGSELMEWSPTKDLAIAEDFQADGDVRFYHQPATAVTRLLVPPGYFAIFWASDAHKPGCSPGPTPTPYRKLVFKVEASR